MSTEKDTPAQTILQDRPRDKMVAHIAANPGPAWDVLVDQENEIARLQSIIDAMVAAQKLGLEQHPQMIEACAKNNAEMQEAFNNILQQLNVSDLYARETRSHPNVPTTWELQNMLVRAIVNNALAWNTTSHE
jgi:hypothetical protein